jgi:hypothetical protein
VPVNFTFNPQDLVRFLPETILTIMGTLLMVLDPILRKRSSYIFGHLTILGLLAALGGSFMAYNQPGLAFGGMVIVDGFATFFRVLTIVVGILTVLPSYRYLARQDAETSEYHALLLFSIAGQCLMAASNDLIMVFIGLEISSIASYVLAGYLRDDRRCNESALKYFLLGSFATGFFLYGVALIYGATGSVNLTAVRVHIMAQGAEPVMLAVAAALMFVGLGFKVSAAPFHGDSLHTTGHTHANVEVDGDHRTNIDILRELPKSLSRHGEMVRIERNVGQTESPRAIRAHGAAVPDVERQTLRQQMAKARRPHVRVHAVLGTVKHVGSVDAAGHEDAGTP